MNTTKMITASSLGTLSVILQSLSSTLTVFTGIPLASSIINVLIAPALMIFCLLVVNKKGSATVMYIVIGLLSLPLPLGGISWFLPKLPIAILEGILADTLYSFLKKRKLTASLIIGAVTMLFAGIATIEIARLINVPGIEQTAKFIYSPLIIIGIMLGGFGGFLGYSLYKSVKDTAVVKRIQTV